ncbi:hypothetical protein [Paracerasibacillus soli]|uniref:DUF4179 domain-containing protein n=1 Tax=Paracerasibacillus soli TaxID=480284 RepID=A0ABU5CVJ9_9BACI|nr:hypothetical protein [Virgibacillus soli]MDY0409829.1 hypothetical protein [Virgibacillus soli]
MFWIGILLVLISGVGNYIYFQSSKLEEPIFLEHYITKNIFDDQETVEIGFNYLIDKHEFIHVSYVEVNGVILTPTNEGRVWFGDGQEQISYKQAFNQNYLMEVLLEIPISEVPIDFSKEVWTFEEIDVTFSNHQQVHTNIGTVTIGMNEENTDVFEHRSSSDSGDRASEDVLEVKKSVRLEEIRLPYKQVENQLHMQINSKPYVASEFGAMELQKDDSLILQFSTDENLTSFIELDVALHGVTENEGDFTYMLTVIREPWLNQTSVNQLVKESKDQLK